MKIEKKKSKGSPTFLLRKEDYSNERKSPLVIIHFLVILNYTVASIH